MTVFTDISFVGGKMHCARSALSHELWCFEGIVIKSIGLFLHSLFFDIRIKEINNKNKNNVFQIGRSKITSKTKREPT
jgi:hypothetical protein